MGRVSRDEWVLGALVLVALACWVFGASVINPTIAALAVIALLVVTGVLTWDDIVAHKSAWNTLVWFATLVAMADGLNRTGFVPWFAEGVTRHLTGVSPGAATAALVAVFFCTHYLFASTTAHATALLPVMIAVGSALPGVDLRQLVLLLSFSLGLMGIISPYATGPSPIYASSGFLPARDYWRLGAVFGAVYLGALLLLLAGMTLR